MKNVRIRLNVMRYVLRDRKVYFDAANQQCRNARWHFIGLLGVRHITSYWDWITCACLPSIVCSMPIINMPALNFQLVSLNYVNTAAPVPVSRAARRFLQFSRTTSPTNSLFLCLVFVIERANNPGTGNCRCTFSEYVARSCPCGTL